jgi:spore coat polysaccharide biosynthesis predicted glycosyltransferase SpsG
MTSERRVHVLIDTAGGRRTGHGHLVRSRELARRLRRRGARVSWLAVARPSQVAPSVIVIDRDDVTAEMITARHRQWPEAPIVALDYYGPPAEGVAAVINLNAGRASEWAPRSRPRRYLEGLEYATVRQSFVPIRNGRKRRERQEPPRVLIGFGATDPRGWTAPALRAIASVGDGDVRVDVMSGSASAALSRAVKRHPHARLHVAVADPAPLVARSSLVIIGGGTMMIEAACLGVPAVVVPRTMSERMFARGFARVGAVRVVPVRHTFPGAAVRRVVASLLRDARARTRMRRRATALVDGHGADRVVMTILAVADRSRR